MTTIKRVILFGAGASYGAIGTVPERPPLARDLYEQLVRTTQMWKHVPAVWEPGFRKNFEDGMAELWNLIATDASRAGNFMRYLHDMARFFARYRAQPNNTYRRFIAELDRQGKFDGSVFATLNYECLLEDSLSPRRIEYFEYAASSGGDAVCWKLHGSCTFVPKQQMTIVGVAFPIASPLLGELQVIRPDEVNEYCDRQTDQPSGFASPLAPSMAVFARDKPFPFQPPQMLKMATHWRDACTVADRIVIIGVSPNPADTHIWAPVAAASGEVIGVGGPGDGPIWNKWADINRPLQSFRYIGDGFDENIASIAAAI